MGFAAVVLAGGAARRMGGQPKALLTVGGVPLLIRVLHAVAGATERVVVGTPDHLDLPPDVRVTLEDPPGGGPVAATAAGLAQLGPAVENLALLSVDLPFITPGAVSRLRRALVEAAADGAVYVDEDDRPQWLCGVWRRAALARRLTEVGDPAGVGMHRLVDGLHVVRVSAEAAGHLRVTRPGPPAWFDCDTDEDLRQAREWADDGSG